MFAVRGLAVSFSIFFYGVLTLAVGAVYGEGYGIIAPGTIRREAAPMRFSSCAYVIRGACRQ